MAQGLLLSAGTELRFVKVKFEMFFRALPSGQQLLVVDRILKLYALILAERHPVARRVRRPSKHRQPPFQQN
jgi:hypothetical protein